MEDPHTFHSTCLSSCCACPPCNLPQALGKAGLPTPRHTLIDGPGDVPRAAAHVGFPAVIKPVGGAASLGVVRVDDEPGLLEAYTRVRLAPNASVYWVALAVEKERGCWMQ